MATEIYICLDLGNDTLKISFAYDHEGEEALGKLTVPDLINQVAFPAAAYYNTDTDTWYFADELEAGGGNNFSTVVKIKSALSLVTKNDNKEVEARNLNYYQNEHYFPQFSFPVRRRNNQDFQYLVDHKLVFIDPDDTPRSMCEAFFIHIRNKIQELVDDLSRETGIEFNPLTNISIVHPPKQGLEFVEELSRLTQNAFGVAPTKILTSTQALGIFAFHQGLIAKDERVLVFDMGDETLSVCKAWFSEIGRNRRAGKMGLLVDSPDGHMPQLELGGRNLDEAIMGYLDSCIHDRETVGSPSAGHMGHIYEDGLCSDQYLMMKDIKKAKMVMPMTGKGIFKDGVPVCIHRDTLVQRLIGEEEFARCLGTYSQTGVARRVLEYILQELARPGSRDIRKILLAGGLVETHGLMEYLQREISAKYGYVSIMTFKNDTEDNHKYHIQRHEASTYAASVGGAVVAMKDYSVDAVLSYSYGTWLYHGNYRKHLKLFANRGDILENDINRFAMEGAINLSREELTLLEGDELFSTIINTEEIERHRYSDQITYEGEWLIVGEAGDGDRFRAERVIDLRVVAGGPGTEIQFYYKGSRVALYSDYACVIYFEEGFLVDKNGIATPFFSNVEDKNRIPIYVKYYASGRVERANASDIEFRLTMNSIGVTTNT